MRKRCNCDFSSSAIYSGEFSCQTTSTEVIYRAIINGSSESRTATELVNLMENWLQGEGTLLYNKFRLRLAQNCSLRVESFSEAECDGDQDTARADESRAAEGHDLKKGGLLLGSSTCYRFQSCGDDQGMKDTTDSILIGSANFKDDE